MSLGLYKRSTEDVGEWIRPFCTIRTPRPPYLFLLSLALWMESCKQSTVTSQDSWPTAVMKSHLEFSGDCGPGRQEMEWRKQQRGWAVLPKWGDEMGLTLRAGKVSQSCSPDKNLVYVLTPFHSSTESGFFVRRFRSGKRRATGDTIMSQFNFWMMWCALAVSLLIQAQLTLGQERLQG